MLPMYLLPMYMIIFIFSKEDMMATEFRPKSFDYGHKGHIHSFYIYYLILLS